VRSGGLWAKHMGLKQGAIGNTFEEHIGNLVGTHWERQENMFLSKEKLKKTLPSVHASAYPSAACVFDF
jgi:hypothetical protein